jgi:hypothetical protein
VNRRLEIEGFRKNLSRVFLLPMCSMNYKIIPSNFVNSYIEDNYRLVVVFDKTEGHDDAFVKYIASIRINNSNLTHIDEYEDEIVLYFNIPAKYRDDYDRFIEGSYSKFSDEYKNVLKNAYGQKTIKDGHEVTEWNVIHPQDFKRKQIAEYLSSEGSIIDYTMIKEVLRKPDLDREKFTPITILLANNITS